MSTSQEIDDAILLEEMINLETDQYLEMAAKNLTDIEWSPSPSVTNIQKPHNNKELAIKTSSTTTTTTTIVTKTNTTTKTGATIKIKTSTSTPIITMTPGIKNNQQRLKRPTPNLHNHAEEITNLKQNKNYAKRQRLVSPQTDDKTPRSCTTQHTVKHHINSRHKSNDYFSAQNIYARMIFPIRQRMQNELIAINFFEKYFK